MHLDPAGAILLAGAALVAGAVNAVAGGGTLLSFPTLLFLGYGPLTANVTNTVGLLPGYAGGSAGYRRELRGQSRRAGAASLVSVAGAVAGAALLLRTPSGTFSAAVPWLLLASSALLAVQPLAARLAAAGDPRREHRRPGLLAGQFLAAVYGAFFGAGLGVITLAVLGVFLRDDLQRLNALKGVLSLVTNLVAAIAFALFGPVEWQAALVMLPAAFAGGFAGVALARRLDARVLRMAVVALGVAVALRLLL